MNIKDEIRKIEDRLATLRIEWGEASPIMKEFIERGANFLKEKKAKLEEKMKAENEEKGKTQLF